MEPKDTVVVDLFSEENLVVKELDGRVYFETLPLVTFTAGIALEPTKPSAVTGVRG